MFYFQTNALGFSPEFLGRVRLAGALASLAGVGVYNAALKEVPLRRMFLWTAVLGAGLGMTQILLITGAHLPPQEHTLAYCLPCAGSASACFLYFGADLHACQALCGDGFAQYNVAKVCVRYFNALQMHSSKSLQPAEA